MAAPMQQMAGGQLMPQQQNRFAMPGAQGMDFSRIAFQYIQGTPYVGPGWQASVPIAERVGKAQDLITSAVLASPQQNWQRVAQICLQFEQETFRNAANKADYDQKMRQKSQEMHARRQGQVPQLQETMSAQAAQQQMMMMNQQRQSAALMQAQMAGRGVGPGQQGFQHLQNPMQVSQLPQQASQMGLGLGNGMAPQPSPGRPGFPMPGGPQRVPDQAQLSDMDKQRAHQMAVQMLQTTTDSQKQQMLQNLAARLPPQRLAQMRAEGTNPLLFFLQQKNANQILQARQAQMQQQQQQHQQQHQQQQPGMPTNAQGMPMQPGQQRPMNPGMMNNMGQPGGQMGPFGNMESIVNEQKQGFMAEQAGQLVVPASSGQGRNATPQPLAGMQPQNPFPQGPNQAPRPQMPSGLDPQQQERFRQQLHASQVQAQAQLRAQAAAKGLQGQPGGLSGPMPASQSPAMDTLNAPVRQPPVAMGQMGANQAAAGNPQFGQGLDPRFNQPGAPGPIHGNPNMLPDPAVRAMLAQLSPEQQQRFRQLPPDKLNEILLRMRRNAMQGRPGQPQPGVPMNPANQANPMGMPMQQANAGVNPQMQQIMQQQQLNRMRAAGNPLQHPQAQMIMENMEVPLQVSQRIPGMPPEVKKWHQFKAWIQQTNTPIPDQMKQSLKSIQLQQYRRLMAAQLGGGMGSAPGPQQAGVPRPNPLAGLPPNVQLPEVTAQEIQAFRMQQVRFKDAPEEQIRVIIQRMRWQKLQQAALGQEPGAPQPSGQPAAHVTTQPGLPPTAAVGQQGFTHAHSVQAPSTAPEPGQTASAVATGPKANRPPQQHMPAPPNPSPAAAQKSLKRPSTDDPEGATQQNANNQRPASQPGQVPAGRPLPIIPPEQLAKMPLLQRQRYEAALRSQQQGQQDIMLFRAIFQEEKSAFENQKFPELSLSADAKAQIMPVITKAIEDFNKISKILRQWFGRTRDDSRLRAFIKARMRLVSQFQDGEQTQTLKDKLTMSLQEVIQSRQLIESMVKDLSTAGTGRPQQLGGSAADQEQPQQNQSGPKPAPAPLNEANLAKQTQALNKMHQRSNSRGGQPPAAPTSTQPPFAFGAASPDGKPLWAAPTPLTQDNLQIPAAARKRVKPNPQNSQLSSPVVSGQVASPQTKGMSPELKRQEAKAAPSKPAFMCTEPGCELAGSGFPTEEARKQHHREVHVLPYQNPQQFLEQSLAAAIGLDEHGLPKTQAKTEAETPMSREASMRGQGSASGGPVSQTASADDKTPAGSKPADKHTPGQAATFLQQQPQVAADPLANTTIDPQSLMAPVLNIFDASAGGVISDMSLYRSTTPNEDTPNSSASKESGVSEPNSDIPETANLEIDMNWTNFDGSTLVNGMAAFGMDGDLNSFGAMADDDMHITEDMLADMDKPFTSLDSSLYGLEAL